MYAARAESVQNLSVIHWTHVLLWKILKKLLIAK
jgi:superoxide dismutase